MKRIFIILTVLASVLSVACFAQGSVNYNNALGAPSGETQNPYSHELSDYTTMTDGMTVTGNETTDVSAAPKYNQSGAGTPTEQTRDVTAAIIIIAVIVMITVAAVVVFVMLKKREDN